MEINRGTIDYYGMTRDEQISTIRLLIGSYKDQIKTAQANVANLEARLEELEDSKQIPLPMGSSTNEHLLDREKGE